MEGMGKGRFRGIGQKNRNHLIRSSVTTIINSGVIGIGLAIQLSAYEDIEDAAKAILGDPYYVCFQAVIVEAAIQSKMFLGENPHENIAFVFERNPIWELRLHEMYQRMIKEGLGPRY